MGRHVTEKFDHNGCTITVERRERRNHEKMGCNKCAFKNLSELCIDAPLCTGYNVYFEVVSVEPASR